MHVFNKILYEQHSVYFIRSKNCSPLASTWLIPGFSMASMVLIILAFCMMLYSAAYLLLFLFLFLVFIFVLFCFFVFCFCLFFICPMLPLSLESLFFVAPSGFSNGYLSANWLHVECCGSTINEVSTKQSTMIKERQGNELG